MFPMLVIVDFSDVRQRCPDREIPLPLKCVFETTQEGCCPTPCQTREKRKKL